MVLRRAACIGPAEGRGSSGPRAASAIHHTACAIFLVVAGSACGGGTSTTSCGTGEGHARGPGGPTGCFRTSQLLHLCQLVSGCLLCPAEGPTCTARCVHHAHTQAVCPPHQRHPAAHPPCAGTTRISACARSASLPRRRRRSRRSGGQGFAARGPLPWRMAAGWTRWGLAGHSLGVRVGGAMSGLSAVAVGVGWPDM